MHEFRLSDGFRSWLRDLADATAKARILARIRAAEAGNFGDVAPVGEGVSEMRVHIGPGYRLYYVRRNEVVYLLLVGGNKSSQKRDIRLALQMARDLKDK
ncbi:MAG: type II toxin-antitoxin system RelE/ParE family toxin [Rhizobiaceae bacterium]|nr:type II toxin-antitoxin system RelE/ParE family toxin [Rhizobiaceae bacterium]